MSIWNQLQTQKNKKSFCLVISFLTLFLLVNSNSTSAHSVSVWAEFKNNKVEVKAYGSDGNLLKKGRVVVQSLNDRPVIEGQIDQDGLFIFVLAKKQDLVITVFLDKNHQGEFWLTQDD